MWLDSRGTVDRAAIRGRMDMPASVPSRREVTERDVFVDFRDPSWNRVVQFDTERLLAPREQLLHFLDLGLLGFDDLLGQLFDF